MKKIIDVILSVIYYIWFGVTMLIFHPIQWLAYNLFGNKAQQKAIQYLQMLFVYGYSLMCSVSVFMNNQKIDTNKKYLIISNHQSMFDIPSILWYLRKLYPIFVAKKELAKGVPSISYNLRKSGGALIDRKDSRQAIQAIKDMCVHAEEHGFTPVIFPEGSRSRTGKLKKFASAGIQIIVKEYKPDYIIPVLITNSGKFNPKGLFPLTSFTRMTCEVMPLIEVKPGKPVDVKWIEECYRSVLNQNDAV